MNETTAGQEYRETLRKVQFVQLDILKEVKRVCEEHDIQYFLASGTLLGAVRHQGFIPWDDDLDIAMTRDNYEKFLSIAQKALDDHYYCLEWHTTDSYGFSYAKIKRKNTLYIEKTDAHTVNNEIFIDLFPYDVFPDKRSARYTQGYPLIALRTMIKLKCKNIPWAASDGIGKRIKYIPYTMLSYLFPKKWMIAAYEKLATRYNRCTEKELLFAHGISRYGRWVVDRKWIENTIKLPFEGELFDVPEEYDEFLKMAYGDYMKLPPEDKRWDRHHILKVQFDDQS